MQFSIIIPVYNEAQGINQTLTNLQKSIQKHQTQIIVSDGHPQATTLRHIQNSSIIQVHSKPGRGNGLIDGAKQATGDIFLFLHSDTVLPKDGLSLIEAKLQDFSIAGGAFDLRIDSDSSIFRLIEKTASLRSRLTRIPYGDQAIFVRKKVYQNLCGYQPLPIMEDVALMKCLKKSHQPIKFISKPVITSSRRWDQEGVVYTTLRNWLLVTAYNLGVHPNTLVKWYRTYSSK